MPTVPVVKVVVTHRAAARAKYGAAATPLASSSDAGAAKSRRAPGRRS
ncbi:MAG TPA: hypothetical protein VEZ46_16500 [Mycobacteriales bacterium]|nr:hypothetical protein [Mycobacteriales bacterium]